MNISGSKTTEKFIYKPHEFENQMFSDIQSVKKR